MNTTTTANIINTRLTEGFKTYLISKGYIFFINQNKKVSADGSRRNGHGEMRNSNFLPWS